MRRGLDDSDAGARDHPAGALPVSDARDQGAPHLREPERHPPAGGGSAVLETVQHQLLHPDDVLPILEGAVRELQGSDAETKRQQVEAEQGRLAIELARLTEAIAAGGGVSLVGAVNAREAQLETLRGELSGPRPAYPGGAARPDPVGADRPRVLD